MDGLITGGELAQLERQFEFQQFVVVVGQLSSSQGIKAGINAGQLYHSIKAKSGRIIGKDVLEVLRLLKDEASREKLLDEELDFYANQIDQMAANNKKSLTMGQFLVHFVLHNTARGLVTDQIQAHLNGSKSVSLEKLNLLVHSIRVSRSHINANEAFNQRNQTVAQKIDDVTLDQSASGLMQGQSMHLLINLIEENLADAAIKNFVQDALTSLFSRIRELAQNSSKQKQVQQAFRLKEARWLDQLARMQKVLQQKDSIISRLSSQNEKCEEELQRFEEKCQQDFIDVIASLQSENQRLTGEKEDLTEHCQQVEKDLQWFRFNFKEVSEQYEKYTSLVSRQQVRTAKEARESRQSALKQQLREAYGKISKLKKHNDQLRSKVFDLETELDIRGAHSQVQGQFRGHYQTQKSFAPVMLAQSLGFVNQDQFKTARILKKSSSNLQEIHSISDCQSLSYQRSSSIKIIKQLTRQHLESEAVIPLDRPADNNQDTPSPSSTPSSKIEQKLNEFDFLGCLHSPVLKEFTLFMQRHLSGGTSIRPIFSAPVYKIGPKNNLVKMGVIISSNKILICTDSLRISNSIPLPSVSEIVFCNSNRSWVLIKFKNGAGSEMAGFMFSTLYRSQLLRYMLRHLMAAMQESQIKACEQKIDHMYVSSEGRYAYLLDFLRPYRQIQGHLNDGQNLFEAKAKQSWIFTKTVEVFILVSTIGIMIFEKESKNSLQQLFKDQKLKLIVPFSAEMEVIELTNEHRVKIICNCHTDSYYFQNYAQTRLFKNRVIAQKTKVQTPKNNPLFQPTYKPLARMKSTQASIYEAT